MGLRTIVSHILTFRKNNTITFRGWWALEQLFHISWRLERTAHSLSRADRPQTNCFHMTRRFERTAPSLSRLGKPQNCLHISRRFEDTRLLHLQGLIDSKNPKDAGARFLRNTEMCHIPIRPESCDKFCRCNIRVSHRSSCSLNTQKNFRIFGHSPGRKLRWRRRHWWIAATE